MIPMLIPFLAAAAAGPSLSAELPTPPIIAARSVIEGDWVLMNWALHEHDADRDLVLSPSEVARAAHAFRDIADADGDGRVTRHEYRQARDFLIARY